MARIVLDGTTYATGVSNGATTDLATINALMDRVDTIVTDWKTAAAAAPSGWRAQGGGAGIVTGSNCASGAAGRLRDALNNLLPLVQG